MRSSGNRLLPAHPAVERIRRFRLLYAIAVHAVALLILAAILWATRVREYHTLGFVDIKSTVTPASLDSGSVDGVSDCIRRAAGDEALTRLLRECRRSLAVTPAPARPATEAVFSPAELDRLRQRMAFAVVPHGDGQQVRVSVMLAGKGTTLENHLVQSFLGSVSDQVTLASSMPSGHQSTVLPLEQLAAMQAERTRLLAAANQQLQDVNLRLVGIANGLLEGEGSLAREGAGDDQPGNEAPRSNPFVQASFGTAAPASSPVALREQFAAIPLDELSATFASMEQEWDRAMRPLATLVSQQSRQRSVRPLRATSRGEVVQAPHGAAVPREWLLLSVAAALALGCVLASGVDARWHDPGFADHREMERVLGVPVLGTVTSKDDINLQRRTGHWSLRILKLNELVVFTTLLALCVVALGSPEIREALVVNPLHAVIRIVWSFRSIV